MRKCVGEGREEQSADQPRCFTKPVKHSHGFALFAALAHFLLTGLAICILEHNSRNIRSTIAFISGKPNEHLSLLYR
jgi:hypothetical protein